MSILLCIYNIFIVFNTFCMQKLPDNPLYIKLIDPDSPKTLAITADRSIIIYNSDKNNFSPSISIKDQFPLSITNATSNQDGSIITAIYNNKKASNTLTTIQIYRRETNQHVATTIYKEIDFMEFNDVHNQAILTNKQTPEIYHFDINQEKIVNTLKINGIYQNTSPDFSQLCTYDGNSLYVYGTRDLNLIHTLPVGNNLAHAVWHPQESKLLTSWQKSNLIRLWDINQEKVESTYELSNIIQKFICKYYQDKLYIMHQINNRNSIIAVTQYALEPKPENRIETALDNFPSWWDINNHWIVFGCNSYVFPVILWINKQAFTPKPTIPLSHYLTGLFSCCTKNNYKQLSNNDNCE